VLFRLFEKSKPGRRYFNIGRAASYAAAANGEIPTIRVGGLLRVPVRAMERLLDAAGGARDPDKAA